MSFIVTHSGRKIELANPRPDDIDPADIAHHLAHINRFTGAACKPYSVAAHSLLVSHLCSPQSKMHGLLHDATEAYLGDVSTPLKAMLPEYRKLEEKWHAVICERFGIDDVLPAEVMYADRAAFFVEWDNFMPDVEHGTEPFAGLIWWTMLSQAEEYLEDYIPTPLREMVNFVNELELLPMRAKRLAAPAHG